MDIMMQNIDVFYPSVKDWIMCQYYKPLIITFERNDNISQFIFPSTHNNLFLLDSLHTCVTLENFY